MKNYLFIGRGGSGQDPYDAGSMHLTGGKGGDLAWPKPPGGDSPVI